jgi:CoA-transferase family III
VRADVIVENYKSDVKDRLGIDYEAVKSINPRIVYGSISRFGQDGPCAGRPGRPDRLGHGRVDVGHRSSGPRTGAGRPGTGMFQTADGRINIPPRAIICGGVFCEAASAKNLLDNPDFKTGRPTPGTAVH